MHGTARIRPKARLIRLIGEELISDEPVALVELVKNAYDADASKVEVVFEGSDPETPCRILVSDDGMGMDLDTVLSSWLEPATSIKRDRTTTPKGRIVQGAKGIGRFASARLAESLLLESKFAGIEDAVYVLLDWGSFDDHSYLDEILVDYETRRSPADEHWTRLTLETLRKRWTESDYEELHARLSRLVSPHTAADFAIHLHIPGYPHFSGTVQPPELILQPRYRLEGNLEETGHFTGTLRINGNVHCQFDHRKLGARKALPSCGPFSVDIRAWDRDQEGLDPLVDRLQMGIQEIRRTLNFFCGVSIYRDGFRVYPYGQKGNDWLNLDIRSRQNPGMCLANNQVVCALSITRDGNPRLEDRSTREGMVLNDEHAALEAWFKEVLSLLEHERYVFRPRRKTPTSDEPLFEAFDVSHAVQKARKELGKDHPIAHLIVETEKQIKGGVEQVQEVFSRLLMSAGLGHMVDIVIHEIGAPLGKINRQLVVLEKRMRAILDERDAVFEMIASIKGWLEQLHSLRQRLEPQTPAKRGRATTFDVGTEVNDNLELYEALIRKQKIQTKVFLPRDPITAKMSRGALGQVLANLLDNSIYWIIRHKGPGAGGQIHVRLKRLSGGFAIRVSDDGPGIEEQDQSRIFEPYFTRKPNGIGLGLYIARLVMEPYGKLVCRGSAQHLPGACFEARFERRVGL